MLEMDMVPIFISFNGHWDSNLGYVGGEQRGVMVAENTSYVCLVENLTNAIGLRGKE